MLIQCIITSETLSQLLFITYDCFMWQKGQSVPCLKFQRLSIRIGNNIANFQKECTAAENFMNTEKRSFTSVPYLGDLIPYKLTFRKKKHVTHRRINFGPLIFTSTVSCPSNHIFPPSAILNSYKYKW